MKVVHLSKLFSPHQGGVETHLSEIAKLQLAAQDQVTIITTQYKPDLPVKAEFAQATIYRIPLTTCQSKLQTWFWFWQHRHMLLEADVIQAHDVTWWVWPLWPMIGNKLFTTFHGWEGQFPVRWSAKASRLLSAKLSRGTMHVGDWIKEFYWDRPTVVTYGGVAVTYSGAAVTYCGVESTKITNGSNFHQLAKLKCVFFGRLVKENELDHYLELFRLIKKSFPQSSITFVGDGVLKNRCQKVGKVTGFVRNYQRLIDEADLVFSSSYLAILESQARGKLVVGMYSQPLKKRYLATFPGSKWMLIGDDAKLVEQRLKTIFLTKGKLRELSQGARKFASSQTWQKVLKLYRKLWHEAAN